LSGGGRGGVGERWVVGQFVGGNERKSGGSWCIALQKEAKKTTTKRRDRRKDRRDKITQKVWGSKIGYMQGRQTQEENVK